MKKRLFSLILAVITVFTFTLSGSASSTVSDETVGECSLIADGVTYTRFELDGDTFGMQKMGMIEIDLSKPNLYIETLMGGEYLVSKATVNNMTKKYNKENGDEKRVIAAVNADLWMTTVHSGPKVTSGVLAVPRGVVIVDGEILCSSQNEYEAAGATNGEGHTVFWAFGITDDYIPLIGQPMVSVGVKNITDGKGFDADGLNRLPANNSLVVYNDKCNISNYALEDAKEVVLENVSGVFKHGSTVKGTVKSVSSGGARIKKGDVILTARGDKISLLDGFDIGDEVELNASITEVYKGESELWQRVQYSVGGHMPVVLNGASTGIGDNTRYPCTIVGYKNDGKAFFFQCDGRQTSKKWSDGLRISEMDDVLLSLGVNSAINLDGGGSSTMVINDRIVNRPSDGSARGCINGIGVVLGPERGEQGEYEVTVDAYDFDARYLEFNNRSACNQFSDSGLNCATKSFYDGAVRLSVTDDTNDPYIFLNYASAVNEISADDYKYIVVKYKPDPSISSRVMELFLCAGAVSAPTGGRSVSFEYDTMGEWNTKIIDLSADSAWRGKIHGLRFDFIGGDALKGQYVDVEYVAFAKTAKEAQRYVDGTADKPSVGSKVGGSLTLKPEAKVSFENGVVLGVVGGTRGYDVFDWFENENLMILDKNGLAVRSSVVGTGFTLCSVDERGAVVDSATIVVDGDVNGDGEATAVDSFIENRKFLRLSSATRISAVE